MTVVQPDPSWPFLGVSDNGSSIIYYNNLAHTTDTIIRQGEEPTFHNRKMNIPPLLRALMRTNRERMRLNKRGLNSKIKAGTNYTYFAAALASLQGAIYYFLMIQTKTMKVSRRGWRCVVDKVSPGRSNLHLDWEPHRQLQGIVHLLLDSPSHIW